MKFWEKLLLENKAWSQEIQAHDSDYFENLALGQSPKVLWIGCSDSRVLANMMTNTRPGDIFVHRNIANLAPADDINVKSVVQFAVGTLGVEHVILCGHEGCGGVAAVATSAQVGGDLQKWLVPLGELRDRHRAELDQIASPAERINRLVELNVLAQVRNLIGLEVIQAAWQRGASLSVHGWVFSLNKGLLREITQVTADTQ